MKKFIFIFALSILVAAQAFADTKTTSSDPYDWRNERKGLTAGTIRIGYSGLVSGLDNLTVPAGAEYLKPMGRSLSFDITILGYNYPVARHFTLGTGLELEINNFRFEENMVPFRDPENGFITVPDWSYNERGIKLKKSKLVTTYLNVPLLAKVGFGHRNRFKLYGGVIGGVRVTSHTKIKADDPQLHGKFKNHGGLNLRNFHWGYLTGFSYRSFGVYAKYYPQSIFTDKGPGVRQVNIGLSLGF